MRIEVHLQSPDVHVTLVPETTQEQRIFDTIAKEDLTLVIGQMCHNDKFDNYIRFSIEGNKMLQNLVEEDVPVHPNILKNFALGKI